MFYVIYNKNKQCAFISYCMYLAHNLTVVVFLFYLYFITNSVWIIFSLSLFIIIFSLFYFVVVTDSPHRHRYIFISYGQTLVSWLAHFSLSFSSSPSLAFTQGFGNRQAVSPGQANFHKSFHSGYLLQTPLYNICLHLRVHRPSHLLFLCSPPPSTLCELNKSCH